MFIKGDSCLVGARGHCSDHMHWWDSYTITIYYTRYIFNARSERSVRLWSYIVVIRNNKLFNGRSLPPRVSSWGLLGRGNYHGVLAYWVVQSVWVWGMITRVWLYNYFTNWRGYASIEVCLPGQGMGGLVGRITRVWCHCSTIRLGFWRGVILPGFVMDGW